MNQIRKFASAHPRIVAWIVLAIGMVIILLWAAKDVGLTATQLVSLSVATVLLAGLCVWIIDWDDEADDETPSSQPSEK